MLERLLGLETEYAIRFSPEAGAVRPTNAQIYDAVALAVGRLVLTRPGRRGRELFTENGGVIHYEAQPFAEADGLVEGGTPECRGPGEALVYQRAQDLLLARALPLAGERLARDGHPGELGLLKNCRDAEGHIYGAQENYDAEVAAGAALLGWRLGVAALTPAAALAALATWAVVVACVAIFVPLLVVLGLLGLAIGPLRRSAAYRALFFAESAPGFERGLGQVVFVIERILWEPVLVPFLGLCRLVAFRRARRALLPFLISRPVLSGAGTLDPHGFSLSEKGVAVRRIHRATAGPEERAIFDPANLCKQLVGLTTLDLRGYARLYRRRQRLQLGLSDSNLADEAEYLKVATTCLVVDAAEAGALADVPSVRDPVAALRRVVADPGLSARASLRGGGAGAATALELQRSYLDRLGRFAQAHPAASIEVRELLRRWAEVLTLLERSPAELRGRLDWITKRTLLDAAADAPYPERKKIDLKYHELGAGYFAEMKARGLAPSLVPAEEVERALRQPPSPESAQARAALIRELTGASRAVRVAWDRVRIGGRFGGRVGGRVVRLDDHRKR